MNNDNEHFNDLDDKTLRKISLDYLSSAIIEERLGLKEHVIDKSLPHEKFLMLVIKNNRERLEHQAFEFLFSFFDHDNEKIEKKLKEKVKDKVLRVARKYGIELTPDAIDVDLSINGFCELDGRIDLGQTAIKDLIDAIKQEK